MGLTNILKLDYPDYIDNALSLGYDAEIDVRYDPLTTVFWLGHDEPQYQIDLKFLKNERLWVHAKSMETAEFLYKQPLIHWFWHETDKMTLQNLQYNHTLDLIRRLAL